MLSRIRPFFIKEIPMKHLSAIMLACTIVLAACSPKDTAPAGASDAASTPAAATETAPASAAATTPAPAAEASAATASADGELGKKSYNKVCSMCHSSGAGGAPKVGDKADWDARLAQGKDVLYKHAIEGFTGAKGMMPARGGSTMSDDEVKAAVDHMVSQGR